MQIESTNLYTAKRAVNGGEVTLIVIIEFTISHH